MAGVETMLRSLMEGGRRKWTVITLIGLVLLVLGLPAADEYIALRQQEQELAAAYQSEQDQLALREKLGERTEKIDAALAQFDRRGLTDETENHFRQQLVELTRGSGCQLRRLSLEHANNRSWQNDDHPLKAAERSRNKKKQAADATGFDLRSQLVSLTASGKPHEIRQLLEAIAHANKLTHTRSLSIRPAGTDRETTTMELQMTVFGLTKSKRNKPAT